jgi:hypothetical protein
MKNIRQIKEELVAKRSKGSKVSLKDIERVMIARESHKISDWETVYKTRLYNNYSGEYCYLLEILAR